MRIDGTLDRKLASQTFRSARRLHLPGFLEAADAAALYEELKTRTSWSVVLYDGQRTVDIREDQLAALTPDQRQDLLSVPYAAADRSFRYRYFAHRLTEAGEPYAGPSRPLAALVAFLNGPAFLGFAREITGFSDIALADAQATRYGPGDFLTVHDDAVGGKNRRAAYVLNLTPEWRADKGGNLLFLGPDGHIAEGYTPAFNALNLFAVPQPHAVSVVAPFARSERYSVTGWLRTA